MAAIFSEPYAERIKGTVARSEAEVRNPPGRRGKTRSPYRLKWIGKTDSAVNKGSTVTVSIWSGTKGSESDTGENITGVYNRFADLASGVWVHVEWIDSGYELTAAEC